MAKIEKSKLRKGKTDVTMPFERQNYIIIGVGLVAIVLGYLALSSGGVEGFMPLTLAPILLVLGYCVIVPIGIMYRKKAEPANDASAVSGQPAPTK